MKLQAPWRVETHGRTDRGRKRHNNEDAFLVRADLGLVAVADGAGGLPCGEVASALALEELARVVALAHETDVDKGSFAKLLVDAGNRANAKVLSEAAADQNKKGMCTTLSAVLFGEGRLAWIHIGDSRILRLRDGTLTRITKDHTAIQERIDRGLVVSQRHWAALQHKVTRVLGLSATERLDNGMEDIRSGDVLLLASDGLTNVVCEEQLETVLGSPIPLADLALDLIGLANEAGGPDNITVALARFRKEGLKDEER